MKEQIISFKTAKLAKEIGFKLKTMYYYNSDNPLSDNIKLERRGWVSFDDIGNEHSSINEESGLLNYYLEPINNAPTQSLLQKWLMERKKIYVIPVKQKGLGFHLQIRKIDSEGDYRMIYQKTNHLWSYEEALEEGLQKALKLL
jgi:hypothetical protein